MQANLKNLGFTLLELILAIAVGSIIIAASYASYINIYNYYKRVAAISEVHSAGITTINLLSREIRMAGFQAVDSNMSSIYGDINTPIDIVDSGTTLCCDSITIIYDKDINTRYKKRFYTASRSNPTRQALYLDVSTWDGSAWQSSSTAALVADYVDDLQFVSQKLNAIGQANLVDISLILGSKTALNKTGTYTKPSYSSGNRSISLTDKFYHNEFFSTLNIRNIK